MAIIENYKGPALELGLNIKKITIYLFGDSITRGSFDTEMGGWVERLKTQANTKSVANNLQPIITVFNLGIGGDTTEDLLKRFKFETEQRLVQGGDSYFVFSFGTNDAAILAKTQQFEVPKDQYEKNIRQAIQEAQTFSQNIVFLTSPPVVEEIAKNMSLVGKSRTNSDIEDYNKSLTEICAQEKIELIDIYSSFTNYGNYKELFINDGIHPNSQGHELIFEVVSKYFKNII
jgi:lysophospholipase L1-like esterase